MKRIGKDAAEVLSNSVASALDDALERVETSAESFTAQIGLVLDEAFDRGKAAAKKSVQGNIDRLKRARTVAQKKSRRGRRK